MSLLSTRAAKIVVSVLCTFPALDLVRALHRHNPNFLSDYDFVAFSFSLRTSGYWAFAFLFLALACTPLQRLTRASWLAALRRVLGLAAFAYCVLHFLAYFVIGQKLNLAYVADDARQPSRIVGWLALVLLVPLAMTSTDGMVRRLGGKRWKRLHRLVYPATAAAICHFYLVEADRRADYTGTWLTASIFALLMLARIVRIRRAPAA